MAHDWHHEEVLELFKRHDFHFHNYELDKKVCIPQTRVRCVLRGRQFCPPPPPPPSPPWPRQVYDKKKSTKTAYPPAPKWRPNEDWG